MENGDLNWIVPGKFIAFSGPSAKRTEYYGYRTLVPEDYWDFFRKSGVSAVVRLNKKMYDRRRFQVTHPKTPSSSAVLHHFSRAASPRCCF